VKNVLETIGDLIWNEDCTSPMIPRNLLGGFMSVRLALYLFGLVALVVLFSGTASAVGISICDGVSGNLVHNCGFETGTFADWTLTGNTSASANALDSNSGTFAASFSATGSLTFLTQDVSTTPGDTYDLSFFLKNEETTGGCRATGQPFCEFNVNWNGNMIFIDNTPNQFNYTQFSFPPLLATSSSTALQFSFQNDPAAYLFDDVVLTPSGAPPAVPEPGTLVLFGSGLVSIVGLARRKIF
jgi:hypothetical protein